MRAILFLLLLFPLVELAVLIKVGSVIGVGWTLFWILITGIAGVYCLRIAGVSTAWRIRERMSRGEMPELEMQNGMLIVCAGILLIVPGFISDLLGIVLLLPVTRRGILRIVRRNIESRIIRQRAFADDLAARYDGRAQASQIVEGEFERQDDAVSSEKKS